MPREPLFEKKDILGGIAEAKNSGEFILTQEIASTPLTYNNTVIRSFCFGCGYATELSREGAEMIAKKISVPYPLHWQNHYFETKKCILCSDDFKEIFLKTI